MAGRCAAYLPRLRPGQFFGRETAAELWGAPLPRTETTLLQVYSVAPARAPHAAGVIGHRVSVAPPTLVLRGLPVVDPATTWLQLASVLALEDLVAVGDYFILDPVVLDPVDFDRPRPYTSVEELSERLRSFRAPGARRAAQALPLLRPGAESRPETLLRLALGAAGFPEPEVNTTIRDERGRTIGRFDLVYRPWKVAVEYDGDQHRTIRKQYDRDEERIEAAMHADWLVTRVRSRGLFHSRPQTIERVGHALRKRGWRPT